MGTEPIRRTLRDAVGVPMLIFSAVGLAAPLALPFASIRPNRIAQGMPLFLARNDALLAAAICLPWAIVILCEAIPMAERLRRHAGVFASVLAPSAALIAAGVVSRRLAGADEVARVSLSSGFWITVIASYASFLTASQKLGGKAAVLNRLLSASVPVLVSVLLLTGFLDSVSILREFSIQSATFLDQTAAHAALAGSSVLFGTAFGIFVGVLALRFTTVRRVGFFLLNIVQTIPSLALFGLLILPLAALSQRFPLLARLGISGIGPAPAILALTAYAMLPVARNAYTALHGISASLRETGTGMGMSRGQLLLRVEVPMAAPVILAGVRTAAVQAVGNVVVTALIGAGGLGVFIFQGLGQYAMDMILLGTLPVIAMAILTDILMGGLVRLLTPRPLREKTA